MEANKTTRQSAIEWWNWLPYTEKIRIWEKYPYLIAGWESRTIKDLTGREIQTLCEVHHPNTEQPVCQHCGASKKVDTGMCPECGKFPTTPIKEDKGVGIEGWKLDFDNDTGANDDSYWEWYNLINPDGENVAKIPDQREANKIAAILNNHDALVSALENIYSIANTRCDWTELTDEQNKSIYEAKSLLQRINNNK